METKNKERKKTDSDEILFEKYSDEELQKLIIRAKEELAKRNTKTLVLYTHDCKNHSDYHQRKYRHWAKKVLSVDTTKTDGYAFEGPPLYVDKEYKLRVGRIVVEVCSDDGTIKAYQMKKTGKKLIAEGSTRSMSAFIEEVAKYM